MKAPWEVLCQKDGHIVQVALADRAAGAGVQLILTAPQCDATCICCQLAGSNGASHHFSPGK